jgi:hypothetical protein
VDAFLILIFLAYALCFFGLLVATIWFGRFALEHFKSARAIWVALVVAHLMAILAFEYYHLSIGGNLDEPRLAEQSQWLSNFPTMIYCFPSSILSFSITFVLSRLLCPVIGPQACDGELVFVGIWWLIPVTLGYLQWFKALPYLHRKFAKTTSLATSN